MKITAAQFKRRRLKLGFQTQAEAAKAMGVPTSAISQWEGGVYDVPLYIANLLRCMGKVQGVKSKADQP